MRIRRFLLWSLLSLLSGIGAAEQCSPHDTESVLQINNAYTYHFRSVALSQAVGTTEDQGKMVLNCDVRISHDQACLYNMELQNCAITATGGEPESEVPWIDQQPLPDLSKYHVAFSLINGEIKEVRTHEDDPLHYVNIKRGALSAFVFKMSQTKEERKENHTDIHGTCPLTSVPVTDSDGAVKTSKDMLYCKFPSRKDWQFSPWSLFWNMSFIQHLINSTTDCDYQVSIAEKRLEKVYCKERHAIMLESTHRTTTAVQTNVHYYMDFVKSEIQTSKPRFPALNRKTDIRFEYEDTPVPESTPPNFLAVAEKMLSDLVLDSVDEIRLFTIPQFTDFVAWIRTSGDLTALIERVKLCAFLQDGRQCDEKIKELALSYLSDALVQCNTLPCSKAITEMAKNNDLSPTYLDFIYRSWSYMHYSKQGFLTNFMDICRTTNSHQCWISLGTFVRRISSRENMLEEKIFDEMKTVAHYFRTAMQEDCEIQDDAEKKQYSNCLAFLKATSNIGTYFPRLLTNGIQYILDQATNDESPIFVRTSALEAVREISDPSDKQQSHLIYDQLLPLLKDTSLAPSVRILSYDQLLLVSEEHYFEEHLLSILKNERNAEVKSYVANSLNQLFTDTQFREKRQKFLNSLKELLLENRLSLEVIIHETKGKSKSFSQGLFLNMAFMPDFVRKSGLRLTDSAMYDAYIYPAVSNHKTMLQLFSTLLPVSKLGSYFEGWEELVLAYHKNMAQMDSKTTSYSNVYEAVMKALEEYGQKDEQGSLKMSFDENIISNIKALHDMYWLHHKKLDPYAKAYFDLFGSTMKYFVQDNMQSSSMHKELTKLTRYLLNGLEDGMTYNTTRVIRIIEAYHQVPTMMGLPLNWTTNATLAFSMRTGIKLQYDDGSQIYKGFLQPSAALTFLNRMVLDFPTLTQIGVQANSSGYTSTEFRAQYTFSKGKQTLRIGRPSRTQKVLELFRTNQMIKHNNYIDIPDWDIERTSSSWCTSGNTNSVAGLKVCLTKSYPKVTHRIKPWALMAGRCKLQFLVHPVDEKYLYYDIELQQTPKQKSTEFAAKFSAIGKEKEKSAHFKIILDNKGKNVELKTNLLPDFSASLSRSEITKNKKVLGYKIEGLLKIFKDFKYEVAYSNEGKTEKTEGPGRDPNDENSQTLTNEENLSLVTPSAGYKWMKAVTRNGENTKAEVFLLYENLKSNSNWIRMILPPTFWEDDKKASMKIFMNWKKPIHLSEDTVTRQTEFRIVVPHFVVTVNGDYLQSSYREWIAVNLAKTNVKENKLDTFFNFTYEFWESQNMDQEEKVIRVVNVTIPWRSWAATYQGIRNAPKYKYEVKLQRKHMTPKSEEKIDYVGWWSDEVSNQFRLEEREVKIVADNEVLFPTNEELLLRYSSLTTEDVNELGSVVLVSNVVLTYPFYGRLETLEFDGYFILSKGPSAFRLQKDFDMNSSYNNLVLTSHSVYRNDRISHTLDHHSYFKHTESQTKAYNTIHFSWVEPEGECKRIAFKHDIKSHAFDLSTDATYECSKTDNKLYTLLLKLNTNSSKWNMLDLNLDQIVKDVSPEYTLEDMTANHPAGTIHVDAEWHGKRGKTDHWKRAVWCSKSGNCPNAELFLEFFNDGRSNVKFSLPNQNASQITYERRMSPNFKQLHISMGFSNKETPFSKFLDFSGEIIAENYQVWKGALNPKTFAKVKELVLSGYESAMSTVTDVANDKYHPLNEMLKPALKMTLYEYWISMKAQAEEFASISWSEFKEIFYTFESLTEPAYIIVVNSITGVSDFLRMTYNVVKDKSILIWTINYFELPYYFKQSMGFFPRSISDLMHQLVLGQEDTLHFKYVTGKIMSLGSFRQIPSISYSPELLNMVHSKIQEIMPLQPRETAEKVAMIFGPLHVYTFDGHLYDVPKYPHRDCSFLLAHDVHKSLFTVFSSEKGIHILFPEMSITIDDKNDVFINGSQKATSLPTQASNGKVTITRGQVVEVWSPSLRVICSSRDFLCVLKLKEFHTGGVIGLLGNADNYLDNEYMLPNGNISPSLLDYITSYEISGKPECKNLALETAPTASDEDVSLCASHFEDVCYSHPHTRERFLEACVSNIKDGDSPCYAAAGLSALCHFKYAPSHTSCNIKKQETETIGRNLEVVLVVQESKHFTSPDQSNAPLKGIESLIRAIDSRFNEDGYDNIKYSLVGFGGHDVHYAPSVHSTQKHSWLSREELKDALKTLEFRSKEEADGVSALKFALEELGYDSFSSKVAIVLTVKDRQVSDKAVTNFIRQHLEENGITLYTFSSYPSIEKGKKVFGVRADGLLFPSQTKDGDAYLDYPRGSLAKLTSSTRGSLFLSKFLVESKPSSFFTEFAQEMWAKVNKEAERCRRCKPVKGKLWWYNNECSIVQC